MAEGIRIAGGGKKEGAYAWKKCSRVTKNVTLSFTHTPPKTWTVSSNDIDVHSVDSSFFIGFSGYYVNSEYIYEFVSANQALFNGNYISYTYNPDTAQIVFGSTVASSDIYISDATQEKVNYTFIDYVVSDSPTDYPDGGEQDGYWYRKADSGLNVWKKSVYGGINYTETDVSDVEIFRGGSADFTIYYSNEYSYNMQTGQFILTNPTSFTGDASEVTNKLKSLGGTYIVGTGRATSGTTLYYVTNASLGYSSSVTRFITIYGKQITASLDLTLINFVVNDDSSAYPDRAIHTDGYYYELLAQISSANAASLSDNALETVQQDYRNTIETEVSNANA